MQRASNITITFLHVMLPDYNKVVIMPVENPASVQHKQQGEEEMDPKDIWVIDIRQRELHKFGRIAKILIIRLGFLFYTTLGHIYGNQYDTSEDGNWKHHLYS